MATVSENAGRNRRENKRTAKPATKEQLLSFAASNDLTAVEEKLFFSARRPGNDLSAADRKKLSPEAQLFLP